MPLNGKWCWTWHKLIFNCKVKTLSARDEASKVGTGTSSITADIVV